MELDFFEVNINGRHHPVPRVALTQAEQIRGQKGIRIKVWDSNIEAAKQVVSEFAVEYLTISASDLEFLKEPVFKNIKGIIITVEVADLSPLENLKSLQFLTLLNQKKASLDFGHLPNLRGLDFQYSKKYKSFHCLTKLEFLYLIYYPETNFEDLKKFPNLKELTVLFSKCESLNGIAALPSLEKLVIEECKKLTTLNGFSKENKSLKELLIMDCRNLKDLSSLDKLDGSCKVLIDGKIPDERTDFLDPISEMVNRLFEIETNPAFIEKIKLAIIDLRRKVNTNNWQKVLKDFVIEINHLANETGEIYTEEREEIITAVEYILNDFDQKQIEEIFDNYKSW